MTIEVWSGFLMEEVSSSFFVARYPRVFLPSLSYSWESSLASVVITNNLSAHYCAQIPWWAVLFFNKGKWVDNP